MSLLGLIAQLISVYGYTRGFPGDSVVKNLPAMWETWVPFLGWKDPLEEGTATLQHSCLETPHGQRDLIGHSPGGHKELNMTE